MNEYKHVIIIIKNTNDEYLQYYDNRWKSFLFLNCKLLGNDAIKDICAFLYSRLKLSNIDFEYHYLGDKIHTKYSESAKIEKKYHHYFYDIDIKNLPSIMQSKSFVVDNIEYVWYSFRELETDKRIKQVNNDILGFVKELDNN